MKKMLILAMTMAMVLLAAAGVCETLRVGMECNYAPYNWTQSDASENAVAIAAGGYADGYDVRIAKIIADQLGMELEIVKTEWDGLTPALLSGNIDVIIAGMSPTAERRMTIDFTDSYYDTELTVVVRKDSAFAGAKSLTDLAGAKITGQMSTFHYDMIDQIEGAVKMPAMETFPTMIVAVSSGAIDGYVADRPGAVSATSANADLTYITFDEGQGFTVSPDDAQIAVGVTLRRGLLRLAQLLMNVYIQVFRGTPMIVQAVVIYYGAQYAGVYMDTTFAAIFIISINTGAYMAEIIRGGIVSVDKGQFEAAHAIGMTHWQTMTTVVLPQAIRNILPSVGNELIVNIKDSSVLNVISVSELFFQAKSAAGTYYRYFEVYFIIAVIYLILTLSVSAILRAVEKKMDGPDNYVIHGSQSDSRADIKVSVENEKEAVKRWNV